MGEDRPGGAAGGETEDGHVTGNGMEKQRELALPFLVEAGTGAAKEILVRHQEGAAAFRILHDRDQSFPPGLDAADREARMLVDERKAPGGVDPQ